MDSFLKLNEDYTSYKNLLNNTNSDKTLFNNIFDDVEIIVDPDLEDESTVDIEDYLNQHILQCRICGNLFPSETILNDEECPICGETSQDGFIYKGKLKRKESSNDEDEDNNDNDDNNNNYEYKPYHGLEIKDIENKNDQNNINNTPSKDKEQDIDFNDVEADEYENDI